MADGYSKMKAGCKLKSRSIDYSDLSSVPHSLRFNPALDRPWEPPHGRLPEEEEEEDAATASATAAALSRNSSVSLSASSGFQSAVKRAMSMRRSSSVAERYCRIHDQFPTLASPIDDIGEMEGRKTGGSVRIMNKKNKYAAGKIVRAWIGLWGSESKWMMNSVAWFLALLGVFVISYC